MRCVRFVTAMFAGLAALAGCGHGANPAEVDGLYLLDPSSSRVNATGTVVLSLAGTAERRLTYNLASGPLLSVLRGTYKIKDGGAVDLRLDDDGYLWKPRTTLTGDELTLRYPAPGDGADIVEVYRRQ